MVELEYAKALYELSVETNITNEVLDDFDTLKNTINDKEFYEVLTSPIISLQDKKNLLKKVYSVFNETFLNFLFVVLDHNRFSLILSIKDEFYKLHDAKRNIVSVEVQSTYKLDLNELKNIEKNLMKNYKNKKLEIKNIVNPELIGGIKILCNGEVVDLSIKNTLESIKATL